MRLIQPYPDHSSGMAVRSVDRVRTTVPVFFVRYRYPHHAAPSGYDRLCDYIGETVALSRSIYWLGETILRLPAIAVAKWGGHFEYSRYDFTMELEVIRHFLTHHNSVYHFVYGDKCYNLLSHFAGRNGNKIVVTIHQPPEKTRLLLRSLEHFQKVDFVTVVSGAQVPYWENVVGHGKVAYVPYAVDTSYFTPETKPVGARSPRCIFVGVHDRDFDCLSRVVRQVLTLNDSAEFIMVSSDARCGRIASEHMRAIWKRRVGDEEYRSLLRGSDVLVLPAIRSTTNTAVLEAMACGLPVITNVGGIEDYLDASCARTLPVGDADGIAAAVRELLGNPAELVAMSLRSRQHALEFSWRRTAEKMRGIYEQLMSYPALHI
jgi:glycosyltransferase involved in cell wall biosynthesis